MTSVIVELADLNTGSFLGRFPVENIPNVGELITLADRAMRLQDNECDYECSYVGAVKRRHWFLQLDAEQEMIALYLDSGDGYLIK